MNTSHQSKRTVLRGCLYLLLAALCGCSGRPSHCALGSEISIPASDSSAPIIVGIDFHMPDGSLVSRKPGDGLSQQIAVPSNGEVTVIVVVEDAEGVKDSQLFIAPFRCSFSPATCQSPGLLSGPTAGNPETNTVGGAGCTQRLATEKVTITKSATGSTNAEVSAKGFNFGGQQAETLIYTLSR